MTPESLMSPAEPCRRSRRGLGPTAQTGPEAGLGGLGGRGVIEHVRALRGARRADRPAIDARRGHRDEELAVEAGIPAGAGPVERGAVEAEDLLQEGAGMGKARHDEVHAGMSSMVAVTARTLTRRGARMARSRCATVATSVE